MYGGSLIEYLNLAIVLFLIGVWGLILNRRSVLIVLISLELMLLSINLILVVFSIFSGQLDGQIFTLFVLTVAAAESAIGLAILVAFYRIRGTVISDFLRLLKG